MLRVWSKTALVVAALDHGTAVLVYATRAARPDDIQLLFDSLPAVRPRLESLAIVAIPVIRAHLVAAGVAAEVGQRVSGFISRRLG